MNEILQNIKKLEESGVFDEIAQIEFVQWKLALEKEQAKESLKGNLIVQEYILECQQEISRIEAEFLNDLPMNEIHRNRLLDKRTCYRRMIQKFEPNESEIEGIKKDVEDNLKEI